MNIINAKDQNMTERKLVGQVTPEERNEIQALFERRNGLNELAKVLTADNTELYEKLVRDLGETGSKFQAWWMQWPASTDGKALRAAIGR